MNPTPALDRLAHEGMLFTSVFCNNSICTPSPASILTGQYSQANGVLVLDQPAAGFGSVATRGPNDTLIHRLGTSVSKRHPIRHYGMDFKVDPSLPDLEYTRRAYHEYLKHYLRCVRGVDDNPAHFGIRTADFKLIFYYGLPVSPDEIGRPSMPWLKNSYRIEPTPPAWELYDLRRDPFETTNVYHDPAYRDMVANLKQQLRQTREELNETDEQYPHTQRVIEAHWND